MWVSDNRKQSRILVHIFCWVCRSLLSAELEGSAAVHPVQTQQDTENVGLETVTNIKYILCYFKLSHLSRIRVFYTVEYWYIYFSTREEKRQKCAVLQMIVVQYFQLTINYKTHAACFRGASDSIVMLPASPPHFRTFLLCCLIEPGKHKHRKCERPLSAQLSKPVIVCPGSKRYVFVIP